MSQVTTHVLDTALGRPATGVPVALEYRNSGTWTPLAFAITDADGRIAELGDESLAPGRYRLTFDTGAYFGGTGQSGFFPEVSLLFEVEGSAHYHVPLLLSPFGYTSYRGN